MLAQVSTNDTVPSTYTTFGILCASEFLITEQAAKIQYYNLGILWGFNELVLRGIRVFGMEGFGNLHKFIY